MAFFFFPTKILAVLAIIRGSFPIIKGSFVGLGYRESFLVFSADW